jgi:hypothetical protein
MPFRQTVDQTVAERNGTGVPDGKSGRTHEQVRIELQINVLNAK